MPENLTLVVVAFITTFGVIAAALITGVATVIAAWLQSRGGPRYPQRGCELTTGSRRPGPPDGVASPTLPRAHGLHLQRE